MQKERKLLFDIGFGILGLAAFATLALAFWAHFSLGNIDTASGELAQLFNDGSEQQKRQLKDLRLIGSVGFLATGAIMTGLSPTYYREIDEALWELKKGLASGIVIIPVGLGLFYISNDAFPRAMGASVVAGGVFVSLLTAAFLVIFMDRDSDSSQDGRDGGYCPDCGTAVSASASFCENCGEDL